MTDADRPRRRGIPPREIHPFEVMSEPVRRRIVEILASGEHTSGQLAEVVGREFAISRTGVSKHLGILRDGDFVAVRAELNWRFYRLREDGLFLLEDEVAALRERWRRRIGWDADRNEKFDPRGGMPWPPREPKRKGSGRDVRSGTRGRQTMIPEASDPEHGLYPVHFLGDQVTDES